LVVAGGLGGVWLGSRVIERLLERLGQTIEQVAAATGSAIGAGVATAYAPMDEPAHYTAGGYRLPDVEGEALEGFDLTYGYINDPDENASRIAVVQPGESLIPGMEP